MIKSLLTIKIVNLKLTFFLFLLAYDDVRNLEFIYLISRPT